MSGYQKLTNQDYVRAACDLWAIVTRLGGIARLVDRVYGSDRSGDVHTARNLLGSLAVMLAERSKCNADLFVPQRPGPMTAEMRSAARAALDALDAL